MENIKLSFYDFVGILIPGFGVLGILLLTNQRLWEVFSNIDWNIGYIVLGLVCAYISGSVIQTTFQKFLHLCVYNGDTSIENIEDKHLRSEVISSIKEYYGLNEDPKDETRTLASSALNALGGKVDNKLFVAISDYFGSLAVLFCLTFFVLILHPVFGYVWIFPERFNSFFVVLLALLSIGICILLFDRSRQFDKRAKKTLFLTFHAYYTKSKSA
ncbi:hypothetical protein [Alkalihalobacterium elongatum]|uniref:hypothetical protein n=1 Tax=Alkalihalobacterium elongatum TaxID=2675466 RepID=UPI001C1FF4B6|nr:hypothetical protein [Alkalihalobacterium elongatum]